MVDEGTDSDFVEERRRNPVDKYVASASRGFRGTGKRIKRRRAPPKKATEAQVRKKVRSRCRDLASRMSKLEGTVCFGGC